jgi:hypothetical protein
MWVPTEQEASRIAAYLNAGERNRRRQAAYEEAVFDDGGSAELTLLDPDAREERP